jgi:hypothetical protein
LTDLGGILPGPQTTFDRPKLLRVDVAAVSFCIVSRRAWNHFGGNHCFTINTSAGGAGHKTAR